MKKTLLPILISALILLASACGLLQGPAPQPQLSATDIPPQATALAELPPTWTLEPSLTPSPTPEPSPSPVPTQDPSAYRLDLALEAAGVSYPALTADRSGWRLVEGKTARIAIPPDFEVLDFAGVLMEMMLGVMEALAEGMVDLAEGLSEELGATPPADQPEIDLGAGPNMDFIIALEESSHSAIILASVEIGPETTTTDLLNDALSDSETEFQVAAREAFLDAPYPMERVILDVSDEELGPGKQIIYAVLGDELGWNLVFTAPADLYQRYLPLFESVVDSFRPAE